MQFVIHGELADLNNYIYAERSNKYAASGIKRVETEKCAWEIKSQIKPFNYKVDFKYYWYVKDKRKDKDNIYFAKKFILDGLVESGVIPSDSWRFIGATLFEDCFVDKEDPRVVVEMTRAVEK